MSDIKTSEELANLSKALIDFHKEMQPVAKTATNPFFKSKYATLGNILKAIKDPLAKCKLSFVQIPSNGGLTTILMHESGEYIRSTMNLLLVKQDPQGQGSALTYARRYALSALLGLDTDDDDDGSASISTPKASEKQVNYLKTLLSNAGVTPEQYCEQYKLQKIEDVTSEQASASIKKLQEPNQPPTNNADSSVQK